MTLAPSGRQPDLAAADRGWEGLTTDGHVVRVRPLSSDDAVALHEMGGRVSDRSIYLRFFTVNRRMADRYLSGLARPNDADHAAVVAEVAGAMVAVAGWERTGADVAEVALLVEDDHQQRGLGTLLLEDLAARARSAGITRLVADTLIENHRMLDVFGSSGLTGDRDQGYGVVHSTLVTRLDEAGLALVDEREARAEAASLEPLFAPRSVAVIGAGRKPGGVGHEVLRSIQAGGFTGSVHVVNPNAFEVAGLPSHGHVTDIPDHVDLAIVSVPADQLLGTIEECGAAGVRAAVVLTAGLGEAGEAGAELQHRVLDTARRLDIRLVGPNCIGVVNTDPDVRLDAWFGATPLRPGPLAIGTQSGALGIAMADVAARSGLGVSSLVSLGNKVDVSGNDLLLRWWHDPRVKVIALYLESLGNPRKFARLARRVGAHTPVLVVKGGRSSGGQRAGRSHTAAASSPDTAVSALFAQAGVVRLDTVEELVDVARLLAAQQVPAGGRLAVVGNGGGVGVLAADAAQAAGLEVPTLSDGLRVAIHGRDNPVDLGAGATAGELRLVLEQVAASGEVDAVLVSVTATRSNDPTRMLAALSTADLLGVTVLVNVLGGAVEPDVALLRGDTAPVYAFPESAVRALGHAVRYGRWRRTPSGAITAPAGVQRDRARGLVDAALAAHPEGTWLDARVVCDLLSCYGIAAAPVLSASSRSEATEMADRLGYPVVIKTDAADIVHKTDVGGVLLGIADADAAAKAYDDVTSRLGGGVVVQPTVDATVELILGVTREETFGSVVMVGLGGVLTDLLGDRAFGLLPLTDRQASSLLHSLRAAPLLMGYRGATPVDTGLVEDLMLRLSALATDLPEIAELDLNPVMATATAAVVVDARLRLSAPPAMPDEVRRCLRP
jgi:acyl-CoA synthetase (NDP forming)/GNAT superfamily N-acetyltransferase